MKESLETDPTDILHYDKFQRNAANTLGALQESAETVDSINILHYDKVQRNVASAPV